MDLNLGGSKKKQHHVRKKYSIITLDLFKPTKKSYPEFDYEKICKEYLVIDLFVFWKSFRIFPMIYFPNKISHCILEHPLLNAILTVAVMNGASLKWKEDESSGEDERFHDREAEEIVRRLEQKYGGKRDKHGHKIRFGCADDYMDKTAGYDLTDPFIDDTEAYDEHVPSALDTARGGFYVNKGKLEFKSKYAEGDEDSDVEDTVIKKKTVEKKRKISTDEEVSDSKRTCIFPPAKPSADNSSSLTEPVRRSNPQSPVRLSSAGAAPTTKPRDAPRSRLLAQQYIKKRRLLGQPPMAKIQSPAVKAAMGVKKKLKPQAKRTTVTMTGEDLAGFLKDMTGGELEAVEGMEGIISETKEIFQKTTSIPIEHDTDVDKPVTPPTEKVPQSQASSSGLAGSSSIVAIPKRSPGRPSGSKIQHKQMPIMSDRLRAMIDTYKQKTKEFGAPNKKIRLPPSLVDLCIRIEEQCTLEHFNHQQKTRIFDLLANWVCVQRNSLYIRMKAHRDRHEPSAASDSDINADEPMSETKEAPRSMNDEKVLGSNDSSSSIITISSSPAIPDSSPKSPEALTLEKKEQLIGVKNTTSSDAARSSGTKHTPATKEGTEKIGTASDTTLPSISVTKYLDSSACSKTAFNPSKAPPTTTVTGTLNNTQLLSMFATMMQQTRGDSILQQQRFVDSLTAQMNAHLLSSKQQSELLSQFQLTLNNLSKMTTITPTSSVKSPASSKPTVSKSDPQPSKSQPKPNRALANGSSNSSPIKGFKQPKNEKASRALKEINNALAQVVSEVEKALIHTENEYVKEKMRTEKEGKIAPPKRFLWTDPLRAALKKQVTLLFASLEQHGDPTHITNTTVVQYLYYTVRPLFKDYVKFRDLVLEILRLCPERRQLVLIPEMKAFIELSDASKAQSGVSQVTSKTLKTSRTDSSSAKISPNKNISNAELRQASITNAADFRSSNTVDRKENCSVKCSNGMEVEILAGSSRSSVLLTPKLTSGQKVILVRESKEREKLLGEKAVAEKTLKGCEEIEQKLQEQKEREVAENRKRDEEAIKKWEQEASIEKKLEAERLEASRDEDEELGAVESVIFAMRPKDSDLQEIEEVELGADTEVDMNTEEDVNVDQRNGSQMCNSESEQACSSTETEQHVKMKSCNNGLSEQSSPQDPVTKMSVQPVHPYSMPRITRSQSSRQTNVVHFTSSYKQPSPVTVTASQKFHTGVSVCATTANSSSRFSEAYKHSNSSQQHSTTLQQAMQEITSIASPDSQASNYQSSCVQEQPSWGVKQLSVSSPPLPNQPLTLHSTSSSHSTALTHASGTFTTSQMTQQQPAFFPYSAQQRHISSKNLQSQHTPTIRHASQVSQQQENQHQHGPIQHPYSYPSSTYCTTTNIQKASLPTCSIPHNASRAYNSVLSSQKVIYPQHSVSSAGCSSAFSPLSQPPTRQQQLMTHESSDSYQQQQFLLQQQQKQRQKQLYGEQQQQQVNATQDHQMYSNWR
uniref:HUN domain-containing protein n=1 Tax=Loa loa TaxID=7209 RepID=A0A1I7V8D2_LOALO